MKRISITLIIFSALTFNSTLGATITDPNLYDVIVVGGGVSGLSAMLTLSKAGKGNTLLLEGGNRLGRRAYTVPFGTGFVKFIKVNPKIYDTKRNRTLKFHFIDFDLKGVFELF